MSVTDRTPLLQSLQLQEELRTTVGDRTLQILERRRRTAIVKSGAAGSCGGCSSSPMWSVSSAPSDGAMACAFG
jgi:hypothetical protein